MIQVHKGGNVRWPQNARCLDLCELDWVEIMTLTRHCGVVLGGNSFRESSAEKGMVLPFTPLAMSFSDVHYYVDVPAVSLFTLLTAIFAFASGSRPVSRPHNQVHHKQANGLPPQI